MTNDRAEDIFRQMEQHHPLSPERKQLFKEYMVALGHSLPEVEATQREIETLERESMAVNPRRAKAAMRKAYSWKPTMADRVAPPPPPGALPPPPPPSPPTLIPAVEEEVVPGQLSVVKSGAGVIAPASGRTVRLKRVRKIACQETGSGVPGWDVCKLSGDDLDVFIKGINVIQLDPTEMKKVVASDDMFVAERVEPADLFLYRNGLFDDDPSKRRDLKEFLKTMRGSQ